MKRIAACLFLLLASASPGRTAESGPNRTPVRNFRLPTFTKDGYRSMLLCGSEAIVGTERVDLTGMVLTLFTGDRHSKVDTVLLSPHATAELDRDIVHGPGAVRIVGRDLEITGQDWTYDHRRKKVSIAHDARVVFRAPLPDILK